MKATQQELNGRIQIHIDLDDNDITELLKGGAGSGNWQHVGRPGHVGGSGGGGGHHMLPPDHQYHKPPKEGGSETQKPETGNVSASGYKVNVTVFQQETYLPKIASFLGKENSPNLIEDICKASGMPNGSDVRIEYTDTQGYIYVRGKNTELGISELARHIVVKDGKIVIKNEYFIMKDDAKGKGKGTEIFADQVKHAAAFGADRLETVGGGYGKNVMPSSKMNGYYTWPRLGYDGLIDEYRTAGPTPGGAKYVSDLMKTKEGRDWWKSNGGELDLEFDLKEGSQSRKVLDAYVQEKAGKSGTAS